MFKQKWYTEAISFYRESAKFGDVKSQFQLGLAYYNGWDLLNVSLPISFDKTTARYCFCESAKGGNSKAAYYMGHVYENGQGVPIDKYQALAWYNESKSRGYLPAIECIERLHKKGYIYIPEG